MVTQNSVQYIRGSSADNLFITTFKQTSNWAEIPRNLMESKFSWHH